MALHHLQRHPPRHLRLLLFTTVIHLLPVSRVVLVHGIPLPGTSPGGGGGGGFIPGADPVVTLASVTPSRTPTPTQSSTPSITPSSTASFVPSASPSSRPVITDSTLQNYAYAYQSCASAQPTTLPARLIFGTGTATLPHLLATGTANVTRAAALSSTGICWGSCSDTANSAALTYSSAFCPTVVTQLKPGTWVVRGASTSLGADVCVLVQRNYGTGGAASNQVQVAWDPVQPWECPVTIHAAGLEIVDIGQLTDVPSDITEATAILLLFLGATLLIAGLFAG